MERKRRRKGKRPRGGGGGRDKGGGEEEKKGGAGEKNEQEAKEGTGRRTGKTLRQTAAPWLSGATFGGVALRASRTCHSGASVGSPSKSSSGGCF